MARRVQPLDAQGGACGADEVSQATPCEPFVEREPCACEKYLYPTFEIETLDWSWEPITDDDGIHQPDRCLFGVGDPSEKEDEVRPSGSPASLGDSRKPQKTSYNCGHDWRHWSKGVLHCTICGVLKADLANRASVPPTRVEIVERSFDVVEVAPENVVAWDDEQRRLQAEGAYDWEDQREH